LDRDRRPLGKDQRFGRNDRPPREKPQGDSVDKKGFGGPPRGPRRRPGRPPGKPPRRRS
jgi:hypothetical protein